MVSFQEEILEFAHNVSHHFKGEHANHSHHVNGQHTDHEHAIIDIIKAAFEKNSHSSDLQEKEQQIYLDKILPACVLTDCQTILSGFKNKSILIYILQLSPSPFLQIIVPPPDFIS